MIFVIFEIKLKAYMKLFSMKQLWLTNSKFLLIISNQLQKQNTLNNIIKQAYRCKWIFILHFIFIHYHILLYFHSKHTTSQKCASFNIIKKIIQVICAKHNLILISIVLSDQNKFYLREAQTHTMRQIKLNNFLCIFDKDCFKNMIK